MKAMVLAAGRGERMGSLTNRIPKPLTRIKNSTLIEHNILRIKESGIDEIVINISWLGSQIKDHLGDGEKLGIKITYLDEGNEMLGTGGGIYNALEFLGEDPFWLVNSDIYTDYSIDTNKELNNDNLAHLILVPNPSYHRSGDFHLVNDKVTTSSGVKPLTYSGMSIISPQLFADSNSGVFPLEPLLESAASSGLISGECFNGFWTDVGTQERLKILESLLNSNE